MNMIYVKPFKGLQVRDPKTGAPLPAEGADVPRNRYWMRRLRDGDVIKSSKSQTQKTSRAKSSNKE